MIRFCTRVFPLLAASLLAFGCGAPDGDNGFSNSDSRDDDDDSTSDEPEEGEVNASVEFIRISELDNPSAQVKLISSWFSPLQVETRPPLPTDLDSCESRESVEGDYGTPWTSLDVGTPFLITPSDKLLQFELDAAGQYWVAYAEVEDWESHQDYELEVSGGGDWSSGSYPGALATPAALTFTTFVENEEGLELEWYGGNNNGHVALRFVQESSGGGGTDMWLLCRLHDDGAATISVKDLSVFTGQEVWVELLRSTSANFESNDGKLGMASGISTATTAWNPAFAAR